EHCLMGAFHNQIAVRENVDHLDGDLGGDLLRVVNLPAAAEILFAVQLHGRKLAILGQQTAGRDGVEEAGDTGVHTAAARGLGRIVLAGGVTLLNDDGENVAHRVSALIAQHGGGDVFLPE